MDGRVFAHIKYFNGQKYGHYSDQCPNGDGANQGNEESGANVQHMQDGEDVENNNESDELHHFIDSEEIEGGDKDSDEGSLVINFQHISVSEKMIKMKKERRRTPRC